MSAQDLTRGAAEPGMYESPATPPSTPTAPAISRGSIHTSVGAC